MWNFGRAREPRAAQGIAACRDFLHEIEEANEDFRKERIDGAFRFFFFLEMLAEVVLDLIGANLWP
jgi:hypothetical protein